MTGQTLGCRVEWGNEGEGMGWFRFWCLVEEEVSRIGQGLLELADDEVEPIPPCEQSGA